MAKHYVNLYLPNTSLNKADVEFFVYDDNRKIGTLLVSKGAIVWRPGRNKKNGYKMFWSRFNDIMKEHGFGMQGR